MKTGPNKPVRWHASLGPINPRIGLEKLSVVEFITNSKYSAEIVFRAKDVKARDIEMFIEDKDYHVMVLDIKKASPVKNVNGNVPVYLYANGMRIVSMRPISDKPKPKEEERKEEPKG